jgi:hypothetical protein
MTEGVQVVVFSHLPQKPSYIYVELLYLSIWTAGIFHSTQVEGNLPHLSKQ